MLYLYFLCINLGPEELLHGLCSTHWQMKSAGYLSTEGASAFHC